MRGRETNPKLLLFFLPAGFRSKKKKTLHGNNHAKRARLHFKARLNFAHTLVALSTIVSSFLPLLLLQRGNFFVSLSTSVIVCHT